MRIGSHLIMRTTLLTTALSLPLALTAAEPADAARALLESLEISAVAAAAGGWSSVSDAELDEIQAGAHDPHRTGFTWQQLEISLSGEVDPWLRMDAYIVAGDHGIELEEASLTTTALPWQLQLEGGYMLSEFGRENPLHPHSWAFIDKTLPGGAFLGEEGTAGAGIRGSILLPLEWFAEFHLSMQNPDAEGVISFWGEDEEGILPDPASTDIDNIGDLLWLARFDNSFDLTQDLSIKLGLSALHGPNRWSDDSHTTVMGLDLTVKWSNPAAPAGAGTLTWTTEYMLRDAEDQPGEDRGTGWYTHGVYGFMPRWRAGLRIDAIDAGAGADELLRVSPLLMYQPSEFTVLRVQYNYTDRDAEDAAHAIWFGCEALIGAHPAHAW